VTSVLVVAQRDEQLAGLRVLLAVAGEIDVGIDAVELGLEVAEPRVVAVAGQRPEDSQLHATFAAGLDDPDGLTLEGRR
jgi:hypothetical protein